MTSSQPVIAYIGLGSNLSNPISQVQAAVLKITEHPQIQVLQQSSWYRTAPWGHIHQPDFINGVVSISTTLAADTLLVVLQTIEKEQGRCRERELRWGPRVIDLDILLYGNAMIDGVHLCIPHPYLKERAFVIAPLAEITPDLVLPTGEPILSLRRRDCFDQVTVLGRK